MVVLILALVVQVAQVAVVAVTQQVALVILLQLLHHKEIMVVLLHKAVPMFPQVVAVLPQWVAVELQPLVAQAVMVRHQAFQEHLLLMLAVAVVLSFLAQQVVQVVQAAVAQVVKAELKERQEP